MLVWLRRTALSMLAKELQIGILEAVLVAKYHHRWLKTTKPNPGLDPVPRRSWILLSSLRFKAADVDGWGASRPLAGAVLLERVL
ncbi:MAG TPA: hypothetical protein VMT20_24700 [Terriglobia bacterium]|nr:hypothetical protein [Terriglobia bacterium]